jgi:hypothetical protein
VAEYVTRYNTVRLHSSIGYVAPADKLNGKDKDIFNERDQKLEAAREQRRIKRRQQLYQKLNNSGATDYLTQVA